MEDYCERIDLRTWFGMEYLWCGLNWWSQVTREPSRIGDFEISDVGRARARFFSGETFLFFGSSREKLSALLVELDLDIRVKNRSEEREDGSRFASFQACARWFCRGTGFEEEVKRLRLKSGKKRRSIELNYQDREMLGFSSGRWSFLLPIFVSSPFSFLSFAIIKLKKM